MFLLDYNLIKNIVLYYKDSVKVTGVSAAQPILICLFAKPNNTKGKMSVGQDKKRRR